MFWRTFQKFHPSLVRLYKRISEPPWPNLKGERDIEYSWVAANMPGGPGKALDFGCGSSWLSLLAAAKGFEVTAVDLVPVTWHYEHVSLKFVCGDIFSLDLNPEHFDLIINCSAIEHVGLTGRYGIVESRHDGDIEAMTLLKTLIKPKKFMLLTIPVGRDRIFPHLHRIYGEKRLPKLLKGWEVIKKDFWIKNHVNRWIRVEASEALNKEPIEHCYGLGLFVLCRPIRRC